MKTAFLRSVFPNARVQKAHVLSPNAVKIKKFEAIQPILGELKKLFEDYVENGSIHSLHSSLIKQIIDFG